MLVQDIEMPELNGYEVLKQLQQDKRSAQIPVIFITSLTDEEDEKKRAVTWRH